jgi:hypothetical protein
MLLSNRPSQIALFVMNKLLLIASLLMALELVSLDLTTGMKSFKLPVPLTTTANHHVLHLNIPAGKSNTVQPNGMLHTQFIKLTNKHAKNYMIHFLLPKMTLNKA